MTTHTDPHTHDHPGLDEPRPGQELRAERERAGISREYMAERLRLAPAQLDALEHDSYTELPPPAFVRGYFRAYAREVGVDPDEYIAAYNRSGISGRDPEIRSGGVTETASGGRGGMIGLLLIALVAAGGIGAWWYQQRTADDDAGSGAADSVEEERAGTGDREPEGADQAASTGGDDTDSEDSAATDAGNGGTASGEGDASADATDNDDGAATSGADSAETASVDVDAMEEGAVDDDGATENGDTVDDGATTEGQAEPPTVTVPDAESPAGADDDPGAGGTAMAEAGDTTAADPTEDDGAEEDGTGEEAAEDEGADDATAAQDAADDTEAETTAATTEPGATSPAATDSPTRAATDAAGSGPDEITLEFSSRSWLEVYDDRNRELVYTLYFGSEPITLQGWAPFEIFLGNSPAVTVQFNGEEIDKSAFTRGNNTARFVVGASGVRAP